MKWLSLETETQLEELLEQSKTKPCVIFKHSTRCSISIMAKARMDKNGEEEAVNFYYMDILAHRALSNKIAETLHVKHESPQVLLIKNGECIYEESHNGILYEEIIEQALSTSDREVV